MDKPKDVPLSRVTDGRVTEEQKTQHKEQQVQAVRQTEQGLRQDAQGSRQDEQSTRQDDQGVRQDASEVRQDAADVRQDDSDIRQDVGEAVTAKNTAGRISGQSQQDVTDRITTAHTEQIIDVQTHQKQSERDLDKILDGVELLALQVATLNDRVYTKNYLDRVRNLLLGGFIIMFMFVSSILGIVLYRINSEADKEASRALTRATEVASFRHQLADCQLKPETILADGFVNPGSCFLDNAKRTNDVLDTAINRIFNGLRISEDCVFLREQGIRPPSCSEVNTRITELGNGGNPFIPIP